MPRNLEPGAAAHPAEASAGVSDLPTFQTLPKELGVMLISAGVVGFVLPGPGTPALIAGGLVLWPNQFGKAENWFRRHFPTAHRGGMMHIKRFLDDLERRYPGALGAGPAEQRPPGDEPAGS